MIISNKVKQPAMSYMVKAVNASQTKLSTLWVRQASQAYLAKNVE
jgi:hypothetical protein